MIAKPLPSQDYLNKVFAYSIVTGELRRRKTGKIAGSLCKSNGYRMVGVINRNVLVHRVIWKMVTGVDPRFIDHESLDKTDNSWLNLRECTKSENQGNRPARVDNSVGLKNIHWDGGREKWVVQIKFRDFSYMRRCDTLAGAIALQRLKSCEMYGKFARSS